MRRWGEGVQRLVSWETPAPPFSRGDLTGNMLSHILSLSETLVYISVTELFKFANSTQTCSTTITNMFLNPSQPCLLDLVGPAT